MNKAVIAFLSIFFLLSGNCLAIEGQWFSLESRFDFAAGEVQYVYSFQNSGVGFAKLLSARSYGGSTKISSRHQFEFYHQELELFGRRYILIAYVPEEGAQETNVEWYEIVKSTDTKIITNHGGHSAIFTRERLALP